MTPRDIGLYALTVLVWGLSWYALKAQLGVVPAEVSGFYRFLIAGAILWSLALVMRERMAFGFRDHARFAITGLFAFSLNFLCFMKAAPHLPSGMMSVVFALAAVFNIILSAAIWGQRIEPRVIAGAAIGVAGVGCLFWPEIAGAHVGAHATLALALCLGGTLSFSIGNMMMIANRRAGHSIIAVNTWGVTYGAMIFLTVSLASGHAFIIEPTALYIGAVVWLAIFATVIAFFAYQMLLESIGPARTAYQVVMYPFVALLVSTAIEGYVWSTLALVGVGLVTAGVLLVLPRRA